MNYLINAKSYELILKEKNNLDNNMNNNNNLIYSTFQNSSNSNKPKIINDSNKNTIARNNKLDKDKIILNYKENNLQPNSIPNYYSKKLDCAALSIKKPKLINEKSRNYILNNQNKSINKEKIKNLFFFGEKRDFSLGKNIKTSRNNVKYTNDNNANNIFNSTETFKKDFPKSQRKTKEKKFNISNSNIIKNNLQLNINKEFNSKSNKDLFPSLNTKEEISNKFEFNNDKTNNKDIKSNNLNKDINISNNKENIKNSLSIKEKAYYILSKSKVLNLCERIIFSRSTKKISSLISKEDILKSNELIINNKIKKLEEKLNNYNKEIEVPFSPSKISSISLNFIMKEDEDDFKNAILNKYITEEDEKYYYFIYIQLLLLLLGEEIDENYLEKKGINILYKVLLKKNCINIKDYLYKLFISKQIKEEKFKMEIIDKYIELFEELPDLIKYEGEIKDIKFISFSYYILNEVNNYFKTLKNSIKVKNEIQSYIDSLKTKIKKLNKK